MRKLLVLIICLLLYTNLSAETQKRFLGCSIFYRAQQLLSRILPKQKKGLSPKSKSERIQELTRELVELTQGMTPEALVEIIKPVVANLGILIKEKERTKNLAQIEQRFQTLILILKHLEPQLQEEVANNLLVYLKLITAEASSDPFARTLMEYMEEAQKNPITGLSNMHAFLFEAPKIVSSAKRYKQALSFLMLDIDWFKAINDAFGHAVADEAMRKIRPIVERCLRAEDLFFHLHGEEMLIIAQTNLEGAKRLAKRILTGIKQDLDLQPFIGSHKEICLQRLKAAPVENIHGLIIKLLGRNPLKQKKYLDKYGHGNTPGETERTFLLETLEELVPGQLTISIGIHSEVPGANPKGGSSFDANSFVTLAAKQADQALAQAKERGRDRFEVSK